MSFGPHGIPEPTYAERLAAWNKYGEDSVSFSRSARKVEQVIAVLPHESVPKRKYKGRKLTAGQVLEIRASKLLQHELAKKYHIGRTTVANIIYRRSYQEVK